MANFKFVKSATALVLGASVLTSAVVVPGANASAKTTYKVNKNGTLVNAKTNKTVKGYVSYKGKLYKDGKKFTGLYNKKYYYKSGVKATGTYKGAYYVKGVKKVTTGTYNGKYYVKGALYTGKTSKNVYYVKGVKFTGVTKYGYTYKDGKRVEGEYNGKVYTNGKLVTGVYKDKLYKAGVLVKGFALEKEKLYKDGVLNIGLALFQEKLYKDAGLANGVIEYNNDTNAYENGVVVPTAVASVSAANQSEITLSGAALGKLKAADITVAGNEVVSVTPSADWKTATVKLNGTLPANTDVKASVKVGTETKDFTVNYKFGPKAVALQTATFDDDRKDQKLTVLVDGVPTSVDYLVSAGYSVQIRAWNNSGVDKTNDLFGSAISTDGKFINTAALPTGAYKAQVTIAKGSTILTSDKVDFNIANIDNSATTIKEADLKVGGAFVSNSNTLVVGETAQFDYLLVGTGSSSAEYGTTGYTVKSSDPTVVSVNPTNNVITANGIGTATLTITVGTVTKQVTVNVKGTARKIAKVTPSSSSVKLIVGGTNTTSFTATDQYGDPFAAATGDINEVYPSSLTSVTGDLTTSAASGKGSLSFAPTVAGQTGTVTFKDVDGNVLGSFVATTTAVNNSSKLDLAYDASSLSSDDTLNGDLASDNSVAYKVKKYSSEGVYNGDVSDLSNYQVLYNKDIISLDTTALTGGAGNGKADNGDVTLGTGSFFKFNAKKSGTTTVTVKDAAGNVVATKTITVSMGASKITGVTWKSPATIDYNTTTLNYKSVLDVTDGVTGKDAILNGVTLDATSAHKVRIDATDNIYVDVNDDGTKTAADLVIGKLVVSYTPVSTTGTVTPGTNAVDNVTVAGPVEGVLTYKVVDTTTAGNPVVATKAININVK
ncbi:toxin-antitoxin system YwqK family antitoxin [Rummeliibacillus pycnus]|uniref:hypothetical protein n=1 Tax=Rummeliibacillus pycnus TaxID=101070 RepID=UPI000C9B6D04|nr:hypothetical protein [Rummeliibacillus pycnus]